MIPAQVHHHNLMRLLAPVAPYLEDPEVSEVMINGPDEVFVERSGHLHRTEHRFAGRSALDAVIAAIAQFLGARVSPERPILEGRLPDGSRVEAVVPPAAPTGPIVSIRRFRSAGLTPSDMRKTGYLTEQLSQLLQQAVHDRLNILVSGGTGSGKTTLLNALASFVDSRERVIVIEDAQELQLQKDHVVQLEARAGDRQGRGRVTIRDLFVASLRLRPDRIVVGELRAGEALDLVQAMTCGHGGSLSTIHASTPRDALARLETLCLMSDVDLPLSAIRAQIGSAVDLIVQTRRHEGRREISSVTRVHAAEGGYRLVVPSQTTEASSKVATMSAKPQAGLR